MTIKLGVVMDPITSLHYKKDSTLAMLGEAQKRGWEIYYFEQKDLFLRDGIAYGDGTELFVYHGAERWFEFKNKKHMALSHLDVILMRKDPPFNEEFIYTTYLLEQAEKAGVLVVNRPQSLRDCNEKIFATIFPQCCPPTLVSQSHDKLMEFWREHRDIVCKALNSMGGAAVYHLKEGDANANVIFNTLTHNGSLYIQVQKFLPEIVNGDKRIIMIDGEPIEHMLTRIPNENDWRGNLYAGATGVTQPLSERDRWIAGQIGPELKKRGLYFVGVDVIGDYLTEINVTSPGCVREIDAGANINISAMLFDVIERKRNA